MPEGEWDLYLWRVGREQGGRGVRADRGRREVQGRNEKGRKGGMGGSGVVIMQRKKNKEKEEEGKEEEKEACVVE